MADCNPMKVILNLINLAFGIMLAIIGIEMFIAFFRGGGVFTLMTVGLCIGIMGILVVILEIVYIGQIASQIGFYFNWFGRGIFFLFMGCLVIGPTQFALPLATGIIGIVMGIIYMIMHCARQLPFPYPLMSGGGGGGGGGGGTTTTTRTTTTRTGTRV